MKRDVIVGIFIIAVLLGLYSVNRSKLGYSIPDEKRYIQSTKEMEAGGDYITPHYHGDLRFQKPILFYWLIILSYKILGIGIFAARFPSIIAGILSVIIIYFLARDLFGKKAALFSAITLATCEIFFTYARFAVPDTTFTLFIMLAIYFFIKAYLEHIKGNFRYLYMYIFMALAMLTKGPLGLFYPMLMICIFIIIRKDWAVIKDIKIVLGLVIFIAISAPWFITMITLHGKEYIGNVWSLEIMKKLNFSESQTHGNALFHYFSSIFYYSGMILLRTLPWSIFLPAAIFSLRRNDTAYSEKKGCGGHLIISWFSAVFIMIVAVWSRESYYVLPLSAPLAMFIGVYLSDLTEKDDLCRSALFAVPFILTIAACFIVFSLWLCIGFYVFDEPLVSLSLLMFLLPIGMLFAYLGRNRNRILLPVSFCITTIACFGYFAGSVLPVIEIDPLADFGADIRAVIKEGDLVGADSANYHRLNVYLDAYAVKGIRTAPEFNDFLSAKDVRVFCVVSETEYGKFITEDLKKRLYILDKRSNWKRLDKQNLQYFKNIFSDMLQNNRASVKAALKEEIYIVSNKK
ncbi:MAG: glycosyltransferase family 39 protein [Candidatus Omnitrophica bacterium]|nr:glycosyltransferase family 39 protein [Candidatus Omnitrophota bacterium]